MFQHELEELRSKVGNTPLQAEGLRNRIATAPVELGERPRKNAVQLSERNATKENRTANSKKLPETLQRIDDGSRRRYD